MILKKVLERVKQLNIKYNFDKLQYYVKQVKYFGIIFNKSGMLPDPDKIKSINDFENPKTKNDLKKFLGMENYLRDFNPNL